MRAEEFDQQLRVVLKGQTFAYEQAAWAGMERLLNAEKKRRKAWWFWLWPAVLFAGLGGAFWLAYPATQDSIVANGEQARTGAPYQSAEKAISDQSTPPDQPVVTEPPAALQAAEADAEEKSTQIVPSTGKTNAKSSTPPISTAEIQETKGVAPAAVADRSTVFIGWLEQLKRKESLIERQALPLLLAEQVRSVDIVGGIEPKRPIDKIAFTLGPQLAGYYISASPEQAAKITALGGLFGQLAWKRLLLSIEPTFAFIRADQGSIATADTSFAFGYTINTEQLSWNDQLEWQIPVLLGLRLGKRHELMAGPVFHQYISSAYTFERTRAIQGQGKSVLAQEAGRGTIPGLEIIPPSALFRYQFRLNDAIGLGLQYQTAPPASNRLNWQIQLRYHLINIR